MSVDLEAGLSVSLLIILMTMSIVGNSLVITSTLSNRHLRRCTNLLILNLSVADLLITCTSLPLRICQYFGYDWAKGIYSCQVIVSITIFVFTASNVNLFLVTLDRYFGVLHPFRYKRDVTKRKVYLLILFGWMLAFLVATFPFIVYGKKHAEDDTHEDRKFVCTFSTVLKPGYVIFVEFGTLVIPWLIMVMMYFMIMRVGFQSARSKLRTSTQLDLDNPTGNARKGSSHSQEVKLVKGIFIILSMYSLLMLPIGLMDLIDTISGEALVPYTAIKVALLMAYANPAVNPPIYAANSSRYRNVFLQILGWHSIRNCLCCQREEHGGIGRSESSLPGLGERGRYKNIATVGFNRNRVSPGPVMNHASANNPAKVHSPYHQQLRAELGNTSVLAATLAFVHSKRDPSEHALLTRRYAYAEKNVMRPSDASSSLTTSE